MASPSRVGWTVLSVLLLWRRAEALSEALRCSVAPAGALHPVRALLERFEAGPGCAAREGGNKETHAVAVGKVTNGTNNEVTVLLKPLSRPLSPFRALHLLLSSKLPVSWRLQAERLPPNLPVLVQVSPNSSVESRALRLHVHRVHSLPYRPRALHRWALKHHGNLSSLTYVAHGNRVYVRLGEDPSLPSVCQLQSVFLSQNYMTSDLQAQEVQGCARAAAGGRDPEVHVIKLHSAGSGLCGSLQVEAVVSLVPPVAAAMPQKVVLILSSSVPVNWAISANGVWGQISVHSSNSVSPPYPPEPDLTLSSTIISNLSAVPDLLVWASERGYSAVTSYTEADLANRFVIQLAGGRTDVVAVTNPRPSWAEEHRLREWLNGGGGGGGGGGGRAGRGRESFTVQCEDGRLSVTVDQHILQSLSIPVAAVTLRDPTCQAQSNGSHFLLVFPVISCGTEGLILGQPRGVQYKNMVLLWSGRPRTTPALSGAKKNPRSPLIMHFSCFAAVSIPSPPAPDVDDANPPHSGMVPSAPAGPGFDPDLSHLPAPAPRTGPALVLKLFVTESYEQRRIGPCVVAADHRVYVEISAKGSSIDVAEVKSCVVSPLSDPKKTPFWSVIKDGCSTDPLLILVQAKDGEDAEADGEPQEEERGKETDDKLSDRDEAASRRHKMERGRRAGAAAGRERSRPVAAAEEATRYLRFSFILRPVYNDSMQFLHCSLRLCVSDPTGGEATQEAAKKGGCQRGPRVPPLVSGSPRHQCEIRTLSRPMVVTQPISPPAPKQLKPPAGPRTKRLSVSPLSSPDPEHTGSVVETGTLMMGVVFAAFVMGVSLMGGLWCIYNHTGARPASLRGHLVDQTHGDNSAPGPPLLSDQSTSSV